MINITAMKKIQKKVDKTITEKSGTPDLWHLYFAMLTEVFEFYNEIGEWKWWKHNHQIDKEKVLEEAADVYAFGLSYFNIINENSFEDNLEKGLAIINEEEGDVIKSIASSLMDVKLTPEVLLLLVTHSVLELGYTIEELEEAYYKKSQKNIQRQKENY